MTETTFTPQELAVIRLMAYQLAKYEREDIIGAIMKLGGFRHVGTDGGVARLAEKLEPTEADLAIYLPRKKISKETDS